MSIFPIYKTNCFLVGNSLFIRPRYAEKVYVFNNVYMYVLIRTNKNALIMYLSVLYEAR